MTTTTRPCGLRISSRRPRSRRSFFTTIRKGRRCAVVTLCLAWWFAYYEFTVVERDRDTVPITRAGYRWWVDCEDARAALLRRYPRFQGYVVIYADAEQCVEGAAPTIPASSSAPVRR
jgi:hypothetical protein